MKRPFPRLIMEAAPDTERETRSRSSVTDNITELGTTKVPRSRSKFIRSSSLVKSKDTWCYRHKIKPRNTNTLCPNWWLSKKIPTFKAS